MTYQPVVPLGGYAGWAFLQRTRVAQQAAFDASPRIQRNADHFTEKIAGVTTAEALVGDRRLLEVALGAFGLDDDINNRYFIRKVLEDGTLDETALANRLSDKRYLELSKAFGFGDFSTPNTRLSDFADRIVAQYRERQFEVAVGEADTDMRLALGLDRMLHAIVDSDTTDDGRWYQVMGQPPARRVFETALGLPTSTGALDLDLQLSAFRDKAGAVFGETEVSQFADPTRREELLRLFLVRAGLDGGGGSTASSPALAILQGTGAAGGIFAILSA